MLNADSGIVLISGGTGFAGSHLVEQLIQHTDPRLVHVTHVAEIPDYMVGLLPKENFHSVDLTDQEATLALIKSLQPEKIYHLAAFASVGDSFEKSRVVLQNNMTLQLTLLEALRTVNSQARVLVIGSADGYGVSEAEEVPIEETHPFRPINPYAVSKVAQELLAYAYWKSYGLQIIRVRPFNHIGERQTEAFAVSSFAKQIVALEKDEATTLKVGNLDAVRDFSDVKDMVRAYFLLMEKGQVGEVYNVGSGTGVAVSSVVQQLAQLAKKPVTIEVDQSRIRALDIPVIIANNEKIKRLGWQPTIPLEQSLQRVLDYWREQ